jgi:hypothetical protein
MSPASVLAKTVEPAPMRATFISFAIV